MIRDTAQMDEALDVRRRSKWWWLLAVPIVGLALLFTRPVLSRWSLADDSISADRIRTAVVQRGDLVHDVSVQGRVVAASRSTLFSPSAGVVELATRQGERVTAGQVLAVVDSPELDNRLQQENATLDALQSDTSRLELAARQRRQAAQPDARPAGSAHRRRRARAGAQRDAVRRKVCSTRSTCSAPATS